MQIFLLFYTKKVTFSIFHTHFYKTPTVVYLFYTFIQQNIHFFTIFYYSPSPPLSLTDQHSLTNPDPTLSHTPRPNTQRKVVVVFVDVWAPLFSSAPGSSSPVIEMARFLNWSSYARLSTKDPSLSSLFLLLIFFISCLVGEKVVEKTRNRRKDDRQPKICWFSLCLVNFLYFLFSLYFSRQPNKSCIILISCFTWFWKKFFDVVFSVDAWCGVLWWSMAVRVRWEWEQPKRQREEERKN